MSSAIGFRTTAAAAATLLSALLAACAPAGGGGAPAAGGASTTADAAVAPAPAPNGCGRAAPGAARVVCLADAFRATLDSAQRAALVVPYTAAYAARWSNLPCALACRNGLLLGSLTPAQRAAALALAREALGASGYATFEAIRTADDFLLAYRTTGAGAAPAGGGGGGRRINYSSGNYVIAFLGTPSATGRWMLQLGGHHHAVNLAFAGGAPASATPTFLGVEPLTFTMDGVTYAPLDGRRDAMYGMIQSLDETQRAAARLGAAFDDVLIGAGRDARPYPSPEGVAVSSLSAAQQARVRAAIESWVRDTPGALAAGLLADYTSAAALARTHIAWSGSPTPTVRGSYVRIDGPRVWIEFVCQNGIEFRDQIHFHTIWRDKTRDYGGDVRG